MSEEETNPFKSLHNIIVHSPLDFSKTLEMVWIYGIVVGWDDAECFEEFEKKFTCWSKNDSKRLKELHENFVKVSKESGIVWHDLREDPEDLPNNKEFKITDKGNIAFYDSYWDKWYYWNSNEMIFPPIAWCEIPPFEGE